MNRWIVAVVCASTFALVVPLGNEAEAARYGHKRCIASSAMVGAKSTWVCKASEICCYDWLARKGTCTTNRCF
jgi:hypothetical protein